MTRILFIFVLLFAAVYLGITLHDNPGFVLIHLGHWTIETSLLVGLCIVVLTFFILHCLLFVCTTLLKTPRSMRQWNTNRLTHKAQSMTTKGLIEFSEGYWKKARTHLIQALPNTETPLLNYLTAARAAQKMGDSNLRDDYLRQAQQSMPEAKIAVELTQAELQLANNQSEQALATLRHLHSLTPHHPYVLKLLVKLYEQVRDWQQLLALLPSLKKYKAAPEKTYQTIEKNAYLQAIIDLEKQDQHEQIDNLFKTLPKAMRLDAELIENYTNFLIKQGRVDEANSLLQQRLRNQVEPQFIELYALLPCTEQRFAFTESLLKKNPHSQTLLYCLGYQSIELQLWGKAKHYLEQSIALHPTYKSYHQLGRLYEQLNDSAMALDSYKRGLAIITSS
jgi:HemY protein